MKKFFVALSMVAFLAGCDDSSSASAENNEPAALSSSSAGEVDCSALLDGETKWNWDVPKECRLNPEITYGTMTDERDGKTYRTVTIGDQVWMAENLNYADSTKTPSLKGTSWCYNNVAANCDVAGRLYTWAAAIDSVKLATDVDNPLDCGYDKTCGLSGKVQGVCPEGWHLPSYDEWNALFTAVGGQSTAGKVLKSQTGWTAYDGITNEDAFGFSALPAGFKYSIGVGDYDYEGFYAHFWSSTEYGSDYAYGMVLYYNGGNVNQGDYDKYVGFSVRCVKD
ncbi:fibrobacter succinogenes major paralogous domain-containing protein [Fibrobacter sp.]|uniref:fibrobacter succinogenes major paralogous domain-containing protein n=1 Tax=Fibrobacter sp. TaxID=35828 RepID=UPI0025BDDB6F|nr:fibrobacter succinogenes major paralogous domain-containing protein [Fibrobacter sp.]